jgi:hypothetical protein
MRPRLGGEAFELELIYGREKGFGVFWGSMNASCKET